MSDEVLDQTTETKQSAGAKQRRTPWVLWLQWMVVNAVGVAFLAWGTDQNPDGPLDWAVIGLSAVCMALGQWLVLRPRLARAGWWVLVTPVGLALGGYAALFAIYVYGEFGWLAAGLGLAALSVGTPIGLLQWLVLRQQMRRALWWLPVTVVALGTGVLVVWLCGMVVAELPTALIGAVFGAVYGAITGAALAVLLPSPIQARDRKPLRPRLVVGVVLLSLLVIGLGWGILVEPVNVRHMLIQHRLGRRDFSGIRLEGADLSGANLADASLYNADLRGADLSGANLTDASLYKADLRGADLSGANLTDAWLGSADLSGADLSGANLLGAKVTQAQLDQTASLEGATMPNGTVMPLRD